MTLEQLEPDYKSCYLVFVVFDRLNIVLRQDLRYLIPSYEAQFSLCMFWRPSKKTFQIPQQGGCGIFYRG